MLSFIVRMIGLIALAIAVVSAVLDLTRSVAAGEAVVTPFGASWTAMSPSSHALAREAVGGSLGEGVWDGPVTWLLALPTWGLFGLLALFLLWLGRRRRASLQSRFARE